MEHGVKTDICLTPEKECYKYVIERCKKIYENLQAEYVTPDLRKLSIRDRLHGQKPQKTLTENGYKIMKEYDHLKRSLEILINNGLAKDEVEKIWKAHDSKILMPKF